MIELCTVKLNESAPSPDGASASARMAASAITSIPGVAEAKAQNRPALVYFYSGSGPAGSPAGGACAIGGDASPQVKACRTLELGLFGGRNKSVGLLARAFRCTKINVSSVTPKQDPVFNAQNAPLILVTAADGSRIALLSGKVGEGELVAAMQAALQKSKVDGQRITAQGEQVLKQIARLEDEKNRLRLVLARTGARSKGEASPRDAAVRQAELERVEKDLAESYRTLENLTKPA
jgi:hypothetical protein